MTKIDTIPIDWFGDRVAYNRSKIRIVTVGLNPSDKEFRNNDGESFNTSLRFEGYEEKGLEAVYNNYFEYNPYSWFKSFEYILTSA